ncbi:hypothetical protein [Clostridium sp.]|uniref:hypothetical protein n=1 Tax=Clostridium sp. TaxID=1506 RepID=UPI003217C65C
MKEKKVKLSNFKLENFLSYLIENEEFLPIAFNLGIIDKLCDGPDYLSTGNMKREEKIETFLKKLLEEGKYIYTVFAYQGVGAEDDAYFINGEKIYNQLPWNYSSGVTNEECAELDIIDSGDYRFALTGDLGLVLKVVGEEIVINSSYCEDEMRSDCIIIENCGEIDDMMEKFLEEFIEEIGLAV